MTIRLAMTLLVRDECDIIEQNIRYHAAQGVDYFLVTDNVSVDGSREMLEKLSHEFDLDIIDEPSLTIDQDLWVTRMAEQLADRGLEDWVIHNDADEFWVPASGNLKQSLEADLAVLDDNSDPVAVLVCPRANFLPRVSDIEQPDYQFFFNRLRVANPLGFHEAAPNPDQEMRFSNALRALPGKIMCRVQGAGSISHGNHRIEHRGGSRATSDHIDICHFPTRSYEQFQRKVKNYGEALKANTRLDGEVAWHLRRWFALYEKGELYSEYSNFVLDETAEADLKSKDVIVDDERLWRFFTAHRH